MEEIAKKRKVRGAHRGSATKMATKIREKLVAGDADTNTMKQHCTSLSEKLALLKILDDEMANLWAEVDEDGANEELIREVEEADDLRAEWSKVLTDAGDFLKTREQQNSPQPQLTSSRGSLHRES